MIWTILQVGAGGALGAIGRYSTGLAAARLLGPGFPFGTFAANVIGSFIMGVAYVFLMTRSEQVSPLVPLIMTGFLGGYTTFSAFNLDLWTLIDQERIVAAGLYFGGSVGVAFVALLGGIALARGIVG